MSEVTLTHPRLAPGVRLHFDKVRDRHVLLFPEGALTLNDTAVAVLELCDGERSVEDIAGVLEEKYGEDDLKADVAELLEAIAAKGHVVDAGR
jgi:pyrroloquinoline quinone biosynthesis protein D